VVLSLHDKIYMIEFILYMIAFALILVTLGVYMYLFYIGFRGLG